MVAPNAPANDAAGPFGPDRAAIVRSLLARSRLLDDTCFQVPVETWRRYLVLSGQDRDAPVPWIIEAGTYTLGIDKDRKPSIEARLLLRVLEDRPSLALPTFWTGIAWKDVQAPRPPPIPPKAPMLWDSVKLPAANDFLQYVPHGPGLYELIAWADLPAGWLDGREVTLRLARSARTTIALKSPAGWTLRVRGVPERAPEANQQGAQSDAAPNAPDQIPQGANANKSRDLVTTNEIELPGTPEGTDVQAALPPVRAVALRLEPFRPSAQRAPRFELAGDVAWDLDAAVQRVAANLDVTIAGGPADHVRLLLDSRADRVAVEGPAVRDVQVSGGVVDIALRGHMLGRLGLRLTFELPLGQGEHRLGRLGVEGGHWGGGTLVVTNSAGDSEILPARSDGLEPLPVSAIPDSARRLLAGTPALAYRISGREFAAAVEVLHLGQFALRQSIADLAHYEVFLNEDGDYICRVRYEVRNRTRQFLRLGLPADAQVLVARVNERSVPLSPAGLDAASAARRTWLLPLERSRTSVIGLVSFPVEIVFTLRLDTKTLGPSQGRRQVRLPLPAIDLPVAYAWAETYLPDDLRIDSLAGPFKRVKQFTSQTAKASLDYGSAELAEGYRTQDRPTVPSEPKPKPVSGGDQFARTGVTQDSLTVGGLAQQVPNLRGPRIGQDKVGGRPPSQPGVPFVGGLFDEETTQPPSRPRRPDANDDGGVVVQSPDKPLVQPQPGQQGQQQFGYSTYSGSILGSSLGHKASQAILGRNYYRAGKDYYDRNDYTNARSSLEKVLELAPGSSEATNAERLLGNLKMLSGKMQTQDKAQKAAGVEVQKEVFQSNVGYELRQKALIEKGLQEAREGKTTAALSKLKTAQSLGRQLEAQYADQAEQRVVMKKATEELKKLQEQQQSTVREMRDKLDEYKSSGRYDDALALGQRLMRMEDVDRDDLRKDLNEIVAAQTKQQTRGRDGGWRYNEPAGRTWRGEVGGEESGRQSRSGQMQQMAQQMQRAADPMAQQARQSADEPVQQLEQMREGLEQLPQSRAEFRPGQQPARTRERLSVDGDGQGRPLELARRLDPQAAPELGLRLQDGQRSVSQGPGGGVGGGAGRLAAQPGEDLSRIEHERQELEGRIKVLQAENDRLERRTRVTDKEVDARQVRAFERQQRNQPLTPQETEELRQDQAQQERQAAEVRHREEEIVRLHVHAKELDQKLEQMRRPIPDSTVQELAGQQGGQVRSPETAKIVPPEGPLSDEGRKLLDYANVLARGGRHEAARDAYGQVLRLAPQNQGAIAGLQDLDRNGPMDVAGDISAPRGHEAPRTGSGVQADSPRSRSRGTVTRVYDIRDMVTRVPNFKGAKIEIAQSQGQPGEELATRVEEVDEITSLVTKTIEPNTWRSAGGTVGSLRVVNGTLVVESTPENQKAVETLLANLRQAQGPAVEVGERLAEQRAKGDGNANGSAVVWHDSSGVLNVDGGTLILGGTVARGGDLWAASPQVDPAQRAQLEDFVRRNNDWQIEQEQIHRARGMGVSPMRTTGVPPVGQGRDGPATHGQDGRATPHDAVQTVLSDVARNLRDNLGQKVVVNSLNVNASAADAAALGVRFEQGAEGGFALLDEAQVRSLMDVEALNNKMGRGYVDPNGRPQETIVGTDALLANGMVLNVAAAADKGNNLLIGPAAVALPHEQILAIDNGRFLTLVRAGAMQHWTEKPQIPEFARVAQAIEVPRVGQRVLMEKTLLEPTDAAELIIEH
ncbi:MAG: Tetratricopeptide repeat protein [Planctomycetes bacterium ADurb.Bin126]|nr:MAG: Tetratricopeptide repeat protein [Planctomycetes bacterium ADurb.Bin126]